jgi:hypothetical protein
MGATGIRSRTGRMLYCCDGPGCGSTREPWGASWIYFASIADEESGEPFPTWCGVECANRYIDANPTCGIPRPQPIELKSELGRELTKVWNTKGVRYRR